jgi:hypothetical protein
LREQAAAKSPLSPVNPAKMSDVAPHDAADRALRAHESQIAAVEQILERFQGAIERYGILLAPCQSGKTGTFHYLARRMLELGLVDNVYLICGSSETVLRDQAHDDAMEYNREARRSGQFKIIFHSQFKDETVVINRRRSLIIVDESHMDQGVNQMLNKFLKRNGLNLWGTSTRMQQEDTYILSVSATPYSELADVYRGKSRPKFVVDMVPGPGYVGVADYYYQGLVRPTFSLASGAGWDHFRSIMTDRCATGNKWFLVRCSATGRDDNTLSSLQTWCRLAARGTVKLVYYTQDRQDVAIRRAEQDDMLRKGTHLPCLEDAPAVPTIVILKGKLRAGKVVPKKHIGFVWEDSKNPNTDTVIQSLFGRMCGYRGAGPTEHGDTLPLIFMSQKLIEEAQNQLIRAPSIMRHVMMPQLMPLRGTNCRPERGSSARASETGRNPCVPLLLKATHMEEGLVEGLRNYSRRREDQSIMCRVLADYLAANDCALIREHEGLDASQKEEIIAHLQQEGRELHYRGFRAPREHANPQAANNYKVFFDILAAAVDTQTCPAERQEGDPLITFCIVHEGFRHELNPQPGDTFVFFNTAARGAAWLSRQAIKLRVPVTSGKEMFRVRLEEEVVAAGVATGVTVCMRERIQRDSTFFRQQLRSILRFQQEQEELGEDGLLVNPILQGFGSNGRPIFTLNKEAFHYRSAEDNDLVHILAELGAEFGKTIRSHMWGETPTQIILRKINW